MDQNNIIRDWEDEEATIDFLDLARVLWRKGLIIMLSTVVTALLAFGGTQMLNSPKYTSTTSMYIQIKTEESEDVVNADLAAAAQLVTSRIVLEEVVEKLELEETTAELAKTITASNSVNPCIITINVQNENPEKAQMIANEVRELASKKINEIMDIDAIHTIDEAILPIEPDSLPVMKNTIIGGGLGMFFAVVVIVVIYMLNDKIKTPEDVEDYLGLNVLTIIPIGEDEKEKGIIKEKKIAM